jgi:hypothetical protein
MAVQYAGGTNVNTTFTNTTGTRREIVDGLVSALTTAGWTTVSGGGTGDVKMKCAATPQGNQAVVRILDPGSGNCAQLTLYNVGLNLIQTGACYLLPFTGKVWRVIDNKYKFFIFVTGSILPREYVCFSCIYIPPFLTSSLSTAAFIMGNGRSDSDTGFGFSSGPNGAIFRSALGPSSSQTNYQQNGAFLTNNYMWSSSNVADGNGNAGGTAQIFAPHSLTTFSGQFNSQFVYRYHDMSLHISDPLIAWGTTSYTDEPTIKGQVWDMAILHEQFQMDSSFSFDGRNYWNLTQFNIQSRHSAIVLVP